MAGLRRLPLIMLLCACLVGFAKPVSAQTLISDPYSSENVEIRLAAEGPAVPGTDLWLVLTQRIRPGWHTYWLNPGDSGLATAIKWTLPPGWLADPILWPTPERVPVGPLVNFGYHGTVHLLTRVAVPATAVVGETLTILAASDWLVCEDICIPESGQVSLSLPVAASSVPAAEQAALFQEARAALPRPSPLAVQFRPGSPHHLLQADLPGADKGRVTTAFFFPEQWQVTPPTGKQVLKLNQNGLTLTLPTTEPLPAGPVRGVLTLTEEQGGVETRHAFAVAVEVGPALTAAELAASAAVVETKAAAETRALGLGWAILFALIGGVILNLMPCVFPVLSIKALSLIRHEADHARTHGLAYTAGVLACFGLVAGGLIALRAGGEEIGWGFQLQDPIVVGLLAYVMFVLGLSLSGLFSISGAFVGAGQGLASHDGYVGSFFTGALAALVATPCTAPFMGAAVGYALLQPWFVALAVFLALGLGMALPFLVLTWSPALLRRLPRPGIWMDRVKQAMAFPLYATVVWLIWVLSIQAGSSGVATILAGMVLLGAAIWLINLRLSLQTLGGWLGQGAAIALVAAALALPLLMRSPENGVANAGAAAPTDGSFEPWSEARQAALLAERRPFFVNFTAAWCITCLVNERTSLSNAAVQAAFLEKGVVYLKGDWTNRDATITRVLQRYGRSGVPLYLLYAPGLDEPVVLPQILSESAILEALDRMQPNAINR